MEKEQIIKALEACANYQSFGDCDKCPAREGCDAEKNFLEKEALTLILEHDKRIEELENICNSYALQYGTVTDKEVFLKKERADTARKMQDAIKERCIKGGIYPVFVARTVENVAKEILDGGETNDTV